MSFACEYCKHEFSLERTLNNHKKTAKYCLRIQGNKKTVTFECKYCKKSLSTKQRLTSHIDTCKTNNKPITEKSIYEDRLLEKDKIISKLEDQVSDLQNKLENIALKSVSANFEDEATIDIEIPDEESGDWEETQPTPLDLGKDLTIEHREKDGYVNVTNLCKAGGKQFKAWNRLEKTRSFLKVLSDAVLISTASLIKYNTGYGSDQATWVHPQVAVNIAQWISPQFDVKVSAWVYEVMMTGKVDITNTKSYRQLQSENKDKQLKIQYLTKKYVKAQPRVHYKESNVVYILTTPSLKKENRYILGKAVNLASRLSTYNKTDEHEVIYHQECASDEDKMGMSSRDLCILQIIKAQRTGQQGAFRSPGRI